MKRRAAIVLITAAALLPATAAAQSQTAARIAELRAFSGAFWQTMPVRVSSACRGVVNDMLQVFAEQYIVMGTDVAYHKVVEQAAITLSLTPRLNAPEVMSNLEWAECRELILHGLSNRQITQQEAAGKAEQARIKAEQERRLREGKRFADSCEAQGGHVSKWQAYLDGRVDQPECRGLAATRERARKEPGVLEWWWCVGACIPDGWLSKMPLCRCG